MADVLVVDDDPQILDLMLDALSQAGYRVHGAITVADARRLTIVPDALVVDLLLPNGRVGDLQALFPTTPVLTVSGLPQADLQKPFTMRMLVRRVQALLEGPRSVPHHPLEEGHA